MKKFDLKIISKCVSISAVMMIMFTSCIFFSDDESKSDFTLVVRNNTDLPMSVTASKYSLGAEEDKTFTLYADCKYTAKDSETFEGDIKLCVSYDGEDYTIQSMYVDKMLSGIEFYFYVENGNLACKCSDYGLLKLMYNSYQTSISKQ